MSPRDAPAPGQQPVPYLEEARSWLISKAQAARPGWTIALTAGTWTGTRTADQHAVTAPNLPALNAAIDCVPPPARPATPADDGR